MHEYYIDDHIEDMGLFRMYKLLRVNDDGSLEIKEVYPTKAEIPTKIGRMNFAAFFRKATESEITLYA